MVADIARCGRDQGEPESGRPSRSGRDGRDWRADAGCAQVDPDLFFPDRGASAQRAIGICVACPVRLDCLEWALGCGELSGIWGGLTEVERLRMAEQQRRVAIQRWISRHDWDAGPAAGQSRRTSVRGWPGG